MRLADLLIICFLAVDVQAIEILSGEYGSFSSPQHPTPYADNLDMEWRIEVREGYYIKLRFTAFDLEDSYEVDQGPCVYDYVVIKEGDKEIERFCGNNLLHPRDAPSPGQWINSHGNVITVEFVSDYSNEDIDPKGFSAHYSETDIDECEIMRYKQKYQLEDWDELVVCNHFCINVPASYYCSCRSGFVLDTNKHTCTAQFCEDQEIRDDQGVIMSPDYPQPYAKLSHCTWDIQVRDGLSVHFTFEREFEIEKHVDEGCAYDILKLTYGGDEKLFCGTEVPNDGAVMDMNTRHVTVQFDTDLSVEMKGFKISYNTTRIRCLDSLQNPGHGSITSPNAKGYYEFEDVVTYQCDRGYDLIGEPSLDCLSNGKWNHPEPTCIIKSCGFPEDLKAVKYSSIIDYGTKVFTYLERVTVKCNEWYELTAGTTTWRCEDSKNWVRDDDVQNRNMPVCRPICGSKREEAIKMLRGNPTPADKAEQNEWPWTVFLNFGIISDLTAIGAICAGSLISPNYVLTAAHCMSSPLYPPDNVRWPNETHVWLGVHDRGASNTTVTYARAIEVIIHPQYNQGSRWNFDVALIRLSKSVNMTDKHRTVCLPSNQEDFDQCQTHEEGEVVGWSLYDEKKHSDKILLEADFPIVDDDVCLDVLKGNAKKSNTQFGDNIRITDNMFCAGYEDDGYVTCKGASGGPFLMANADTGIYYQNGLVSFAFEGNQCGKVVSYTVFTRLNKVIMDWVMQNTGDLLEIGL